MERLDLFNYSNPIIPNKKYLRVAVHHRNRDSESFVGKELGGELVKTHHSLGKEMTQRG